jgi:hypothetical protein
VKLENTLTSISTLDGHVNIYINGTGRLGTTKYQIIIFENDGNIHQIVKRKIDNFQLPTQLWVKGYFFSPKPYMMSQINRPFKIYFDNKPICPKSH